MSAVHQRLVDQIGGICANHIEPIFNRPAKVTVLVRFDDDPEGRFDILVTSDTDDGIKAIVARRLEAQHG